MSDRQWIDRIVGDRMAVDREFTERINESRFSSQQWGLIMTATEFEITDPQEPERAELVANAEKLPQIMPELEKIDAQAVPGGAGGPSGSSRSSGELLNSVKSALGLGGGGGNDEDRQAAEALVGEYAARLQERLENQGKWESVCRTAADQSSSPA